MLLLMKSYLLQLLPQVLRRDCLIPQYRLKINYILLPALIILYSPFKIKFPN